MSGPDVLMAVVMVYVSIAALVLMAGVLDYNNVSYQLSRDGFRDAPFIRERLLRSRRESAQRTLLCWAWPLYLIRLVWRVGVDAFGPQSGL